MFTTVSHATGQTTDAMALKLYSETILLLKLHSYDGFSNQNNIDRSFEQLFEYVGAICKFTAIEKIATDGSRLFKPTGQTTNAMALKRFSHTTL